jgi:hypothetical protein
MILPNEIKLIDLINVTEEENLCTIYLYYDHEFIAYPSFKDTKNNERNKYVKSFRISPVLINDVVRFNMTIYLYDL